MSECKECGGPLDEFPIGNCTTPHVEDSPDEKPREWWIFPPTEDSIGECHDEKLYPGDVRVIEFSAYEQVCREKDELMNRFGEERTEFNKVLNERDELRSDLKKCKAEYADYVRGKPGSWYVVQQQKEIDELRKENERLKYKQLFEAVIAADEKLRAKCAAYEEALARVVEPIYGDDGEAWDDANSLEEHERIAREVLEKYK